MKHKIIINLIKILRGAYHRYFMFLGKSKFYLYKILYSHINFGENIKVYGNIYLSLNGNADFGENIQFNNHTRFNYCGIKTPSSIFIEKHAYLKIGNNTGFSGTAIYCSTKIIIGNNCNFGANSSVWDTDFHPLNSTARKVHDVTQIKKAEVIIEDNVFVGANVIIMNGVKIGEGAVIGAGSVVTKDVQPYTINVGSPAKRIRETN